MADKYSLIAPCYDVLSAEYPVYRAGRKAGMAALAAAPGAQVLDLGCGTGLNFSFLQQQVGSSGTIVGIDRSAEMLKQARRRAARHNWDNIILVQADAVELSPADVGVRLATAGGRQHSDAAVATYALSLMPRWQDAWANLFQLCRPGARISVVDMQDPTGAAAVFTPLARIACRLGGSDITARPWQAVELDCVDVSAASARGGHLQIRAGRVPGRPASG